MRNLGLLRVEEHGGGERQLVTGRGHQRAAVARLAAGGRIEAGAVDQDPALVGHTEHLGGAVLEEGVLAKQAVSRHAAPSHTNGTLTLVLRASQSGTGRFLARRKSGLNSFDWERVP